MANEEVASLPTTQVCACDAPAADAADQWMSPRRGNRCQLPAVHSRINGVRCRSGPRKSPSAHILAPPLCPVPQMMFRLGLGLGGGTSDHFVPSQWMAS